MDDDGSFIEYKAHQAYNYFGNPHTKKQVTAVQPHTNYRYTQFLDSVVYADFNQKTLGAISDPPEAGSSEWDEAEWDVSPWGASTSRTSPVRKNVTGYGFALSHVLRFRSKAQIVIWHMTDWFFRTGGGV